MKRRTFLQIAGASGASLGAPAILRAQGKRFEGITIRTNGYGGDYDRILKEHVAKPLEESTGLKVEYQASTMAAAVAKLVASRDNPPFDMLMADSPNVPELINAAVAEPLTAKEVPNISKLLPKVREFGDIGIPYLTNAIILTYNTQLLKQPVAAFADLARPDLKGRVGMLTPENTGGLLFMIALAESNGGSLDNLEPGFAALAKMRGNVSATTPATVALLQMFEQGEIWCGPYFDGRIYSMRSHGKPMASVIPKEGVYGLYNYLVPVKGGKNREAVLAYMNQALSDQAIGALVEFFRYAPCTNIALPPAVAKEVAVLPARDPIKPVDWAKVAKMRGDISERFNKAMR
jgi:putative spermidine/putrescine transport system substrate-binding protein